MKQLLLISTLAFSILRAAAADAPALDGSQSFTGKVLETTNTAGYTYVLVESGAQKVWAAAVQFAVNTGDTVTVGPGALMTQYHSKTLNRDFDAVVFTGSITVNGAGSAAPATAQLPPGHPALTGNASAAALPPGHPSLTGAAAAPNLDLTGIKKADGGNTIAEIYAGKATLAGKTVTVRGKVVKYNAMILGKNWLHIRDGSGAKDDQNNDLTITTATPAKLGDTVLVTGKVSVDRDFGAGYKYAVILEDAQVTVE
jgi:hypothetical protein